MFGSADIGRRVWGLCLTYEWGHKFVRRVQQRMRRGNAVNVKSVLQNTVLCCFATGIVCTPFRSALADGTAAHDFDPLDVLIPIIATSADDPWRNRSLWERYAPYCPEATIGGIDVPKYPSKPSAGNECNDGDMTLFNGLLCASGDDRGCDGVKRAQSPDGRFWRSPRRALTNNGGLGDSDDSKSFSPDMSLGVLLYVAKTGDTHALSTWLKWIEEHRPCIARQEDVNWIAAHCYCYNDLYTPYSHKLRFFT
jgi:hypothetical protein